MKNKKDMAYEIAEGLVELRIDELYEMKEKFEAEFGESETMNEIVQKIVNFKMGEC